MTNEYYIKNKKKFQEYYKNNKKKIHDYYLEHKDDIKQYNHQYYINKKKGTTEEQVTQLTVQKGGYLTFDDY
jgi:hypothetical protein